MAYLHQIYCDNTQAVHAIKEGLQAAGVNPTVTVWNMGTYTGVGTLDYFCVSFIHKEWGYAVVAEWLGAEDFDFDDLITEEK